MPHNNQVDKTYRPVNVILIWLPKLFKRHKLNMATVAQLESLCELNKMQSAWSSVLPQHSKQRHSYLLYQNHSPPLVVTSFVTFQVNLNNLNNHSFSWDSVNLREPQLCSLGCQSLGRHSIHRVSKIVVIEAKILKQYGFLLIKEKLAFFSLIQPAHSRNQCEAPAYRWLDITFYNARGCNLSSKGYLHNPNEHVPPHNTFCQHHRL